ncbi:MAG: Bax inhibitor-1/YccA family protein [Candidatus Caenarcaniphilales bacterium]|nr:Bax inhibitor-1/YccA family protein [Candidatus Caenarcaniphilales bacterium]
MRSSNPVLKEDSFHGTSVLPSQAMSIQGTINKSLMLGLILVLSGAYSWSQCAQAIAAGNPGLIKFYLYGGLFGGLILGFITVFKKEWSPITSLIYAAIEGLFLGAISWMFEASFPGIVQQATLCTISTLFGLLFLYKTQIIKVTEKFRSVILISTMGIGVVYLLSFLLGFFGIQLPLIHESGIIGIGFSLFVTTIAALNLLLDFDFIENAALKGSLPKYMEWYAAFGLIVTLVWIYIEFLRLLSKLRRR